MKIKPGYIYSGDENEFENTLRFHQVNLRKHVTLNIVTSGYDDRFLMNKVTCSVSTYGDVEMEVSFDEESKARHFIHDVLGIDTDNIEWKETLSISGYTDNRTHSTAPITREVATSINSFLQLRQRGKFTAKHVSDCETWLSNHPITADVMKIVEYQLSECDRKNVQMWGHPNGQSAK